MKKEIKMEIIKSEQDNYYKASKKQKGSILDRICQTCNLTRKHVIKRLAKPILSKQELKQVKKTRTRAFIYSKELFRTISEVWKKFNYPCGPKLKAILLNSKSIIQSTFALCDNDMKLIFKVSPSTLNIRLKDLTRKDKKKFANATRCGRFLKNSIPIRSDFSIPTQSGHISIDLVAHCGDNNFGDFIYSLNVTDRFSGWTLAQSFIGKSQFHTVSALDNLIKLIPFTILSIHSDNGSEFINAHLQKFCSYNKFSFTRSRPYKKNDNAHIEQKNFTHVRKILGYMRYDTPHLVSRINKLYLDANLFFNLFTPCSKLISKERSGSSIKKVYDNYQTPLKRLLSSNSKNLKPILFNNYIHLASTINPFPLSDSIEQQVCKIVSIASKFKSNANLLRHA
ncbi:MAG: transposase family protein [Endomicrobium sp.]|nr:transposase family protein [Endomicrobium sp.]